MHAIDLMIRAVAPAVAVAILAAGAIAQAAPASIPTKPEAAAPAAPHGDVDAAGLFAERCASCHMGGVPKAPHAVMFQVIGPDAIAAALTSGVMQTQAEGLTSEEISALAAFLGGTSAGSKPVKMCTDRTVADARPAFEGWGLTLAGTRAVDAESAGLSKEDAARLELKWAFAYPGASRARSQPTVYGDVVFVGSQGGAVYALDFASGCARWTFAADAEVRNAVNVAATPDGPLALFGDIQGHVYAVDARTGALQWRAVADAHPDVTLTGSPRLYDGALYVPLSSTEWASAADPAYECCTFRGGVAKFDVATGALLWKTYSIPQTPAPTGETNAAGAARFHPAGAPIWNSPTIDEKRGVLYVGTGEAYTSPAADTSDSVLAIDLKTGAVRWTYQSIAGDAWNMACFIGGGPNCPEENGPDLDIGAPPMLVTDETGRDLVVVGQKSGDVFALDPDDNGALIWKKKIGRGGFAGGVHWGMASDGRTVYAPNADTEFIGRFKGERKPGLFALDAATGETRWFAAAPLTCAEEEKPACDPGYSAPVTVAGDLVFAGAFDGHLRAYDKASGDLLWDFDTNRDFPSVSGETARGGSIESAGPVVANGRVLVNSGYLFGDRMPGNALLVFEAADAPTAPGE
ncbi:MAG: PQQ-binding-like beta-propeller repeat protein [Pseudomonadota bacterium]